MGSARFWDRLAGGIAIATAVVAVGCGSTTPVAPTPAPAPWTQYPSLIGDVTQWRENNSQFSEQVVGSSTPALYNCDTRMSVRTQTDGVFTGVVVIEGISPEGDSRCHWDSPFMAEMTREGTITSFRTERLLPTSRCGSGSEPAVSGTASSTAIRITVTQRSTCVAPSGTPRETDLTIVMSVARSSSAASQTRLVLSGHLGNSSFRGPFFR